MQFVSIVLCTLLLFWSHSSFATNTSGVFGPVVNPNDSSGQYRIGFRPGENGDDDAHNHRFHYQRAISDTLRWRVITQLRSRDGDFEYDYLRGELLWYLTPDKTSNWDSGIRFDIRSRKGSRAEQFSINWTNQWALSPKWRLRGVASGHWKFGGNAEGGTELETRASLTYKLDSGMRAGIEMFNNYGKVSDMGSFNDQEHVIGPSFSGKVDGISIKLGYLAGITSAADDHSIRLWIGRSF